MDFSQMFEKVKELQEKVKVAQENLVNITTTGEAGAGMVKVTVNGKRQVTDIEIDPDLIKPDDKEMIEDLVLAATNKALEAIEGKIQEEMKKHTSGMMPNIPGMDLSNFM